MLQGYRRAYRLDTPSTFKNPLSHVVLGGQGIGRLSPTMARPKSSRRVHKDQLALAVRKHFNSLGVSENEVIVDWLYKTKHQGASLTTCALSLHTDFSVRQGISRSICTPPEMMTIRCTLHPVRCTSGVLLRYPLSGHSACLHFTLYTLSTYASIAMALSWNKHHRVGKA